MKEKNAFLYVSFASLILVAGIRVFSVSPINKQKGKLISGVPSSIGTEEDVNARANWEFNRLRDPSTGRIPDHIRQKELAYAATLPNDYSLSLKNASLNSASIWSQRGPWNVGGKTRALAIDVSNENIILAGSTSGGMWRSTDGGLTWTETTALTQNQNVTCVAQDTRIGHTNIWYYGGGENNGASASGGGDAYYSGNGIYKSTDGGLKWNSLPSTDAGTPQNFENFWDAIFSVATNPADTLNDVVYAATIGAVFKSMDGGATWTIVLGGNYSGYSNYTDVKVTSTGVVYAALSSDGLQKGIWRSDDGITFTNITPASFPATYDRIVIGVAPSDENQVYFLANTPGFGTSTLNFLDKLEWNSIWKYKYISGNGTAAGGIWSDRSAGIPALGGIYDHFFCQGSYDLLIRVKPNDTNTVFIGGTNLYRSTNGFSDQTQTKQIGGYKEGHVKPYNGTQTLLTSYYANHYPDQHELVFLPSNPNVMFSGNDQGVFKTLDNTASTVSWTPLINGYMTTLFYTTAINHAVSGDNTIIGGTQDIGSWFTNSTNLTSPWTESCDGDGSFCAIADNQTDYYFSAQLGQITKATLDASGNATAFARIDPIGGKDYLFINPFVLDPNDNNIMYMAGGKRIWRNDNLSAIPLVNNWDSISTNWIEFPDTVDAGSRITAITACKTPANRIYYGTSNKKVYRIDGANTGTPAPVDITQGLLFPSGGYVSCIAADPRDGNKVMVIFSNYNVYSIFSSTNAGTSWSRVAGNMEQFANGTGNGPSCRWVSILPVSDGVVYLLGTSTGLYATDTLRGTATVWGQMGANIIGNVVCDMIDTRPSDGMVVVATHGHGMYSTTITNVKDIDVTSVRDDLSFARDDFQLKNYPNPFRQSTTIEFILSKKTKVEIKILDERGRVTALLADEELSAGKHALQFNRGNFSKGIYYCVLEAGSYRKTQKMILIE
ncbi:MAG: T9SS type A sorting domain-containing protein [Bacteroidetes bacterium]|nr:T9SS type A sorting domain-containing protein [Bacteroidota bacterium]